MSDQPTCPRCGRPIHDQAYVDSRCGRDLEHALEKVALVAGETTTTVAKLDHIGEGGQRTDPEAPLPVNLDAAQRHDAAVTALTTWARHASETRGINPTGSGHPLAVLARWLVGQVDWLRHRREAEEAFDELTEACKTIVAVVDRPPERWYAGRCDAPEGCNEELRPHAGAKTIRCGCGLEYDAEKRKAKLLRDLDDVWVTADQCSFAMGNLGMKVDAATIRKWGSADRARLAPHPDSLPGRPRYRVGSVRELVEHMHAEQRERTLRAAVKAAELAERRSRREKVGT